MKSIHAIIRYDGPALANHQMDVHDLAPALLALGELCRAANTALNGEQAAVKVLVRADIEQKCFQLKFELVQTLYEQLTTLLDDKQIQDAKDVLEWLQILGVPAAGVGLLALFRFLSKKKPTDKIEIRNDSGTGNVIYQIVGNDNQLIVPSEVDRIAQHPKVLPSLKEILTPLAKAGYESLAFEHKGKTTEYISRDEAHMILGLAPDVMDIERDGELVSTIRTTVKIKRPVYEGDGMWTVIFKKAIDVKILDDDWIADFQRNLVHAPPGAKLLVDLVEKTPIDDDGMASGNPKYTIKKVHHVVLPTEQLKLFSGGTSG